MKNKLIFSMLFVFLFLVSEAKSQDNNQVTEVISYSLPAMRILALEGTPPSLIFTAPTSGGVAIQDASCNTSWINYTSVITSGTTNKITVALTDSEVPAGTTLSVAASVYTGVGEGSFGTPTGTVVLSNSSQELITGIGSCYTGIGNTNGHQLTYTWSINLDDYADLVTSGTSSLTATYTIIAGI